MHFTISRSIQPFLLSDQGAFFSAANESLQKGDELASTFELLEWQKKNSGREINEAFSRLLHFIQNPTAVSLDLSKVSRFTLEVPPLFGEIFRSRLKALHLSNNCWRWKGEGIEQLSALEELHLDNCHLSSIYRSIETLSQLRILHLQENPLGSLNVVEGAEKRDFNFQNLTHLEELDVRCNELQILPSSLNQTTLLKILRLSRNRFSGLPLDFSLFAHLKYLDLSDQIPEFYRSLPVIVQFYLRHVPHLEFLDLSHSSYSFHLSSELLCLPSSCTIHLNFRIIPGSIRDALARARFAADYEGPIFEGLLYYTRVSFSELSFCQAFDALQVTIDIEQWRHSIRYWASDKERNKACDELLELVLEKSRISCNLKEWVGRKLQELAVDYEVKRESSN